jgi:hypothetical protein
MSIGLGLGFSGVGGVGFVFLDVGGDTSTLIGRISSLCLRERGLSGGGVVDGWDCCVEGPTADRSRVALIALAIHQQCV